MKNLKENTKQYEYGRLLDRSEASRLHEVVEAWKHSPYLYGLKGRDLARMATLAENQKRVILRENNTTADMAVFDTIAIPMIRRQNVLMVTPNLISVQPLSYPNGVVFFLDYQVSSTKNAQYAHYLANGAFSDGFNGNVFGEQNADGSPTSGYDRHYNNRGYDNTKGRRFERGYTAFGTNPNDGGIAATFQANGANFGGVGVANTVVADFDLTAAGGITMDNVASLRVFLSNVALVEGVDYFVQKSIQNWTDYALSTGRQGAAGQTTTFLCDTTNGVAVLTNVPANIAQFIIIGSVITGANIPAGTRVVTKTATTITMDANATGTAAIADATGFLAPTTAGSNQGQWQGPSSTENGITGPGVPNKILRLKIIPAATGYGVLNIRIGYAQYLNLELNPSWSSELKLKITSSPIQTYIHKMKTAWTVELSQDLMAYHAIDAEAELTQLMAEEVAAEKDRMIIRELVTLAAHFEVWNADFANAIDPNPANTVFRGHEGTYNQTLMFAINRVNGKIQKSTRKGGANWILISAEGAAKLQNLDTFKPMDVNDEGTKFAAGVELIGRLNQKWTIYVDPSLPAEVCLMGRKGTSFFDTGYVYCPYIEYILSPIVHDPQTYNPSRQIASRFGTAMLNNKFYGVVWMRGIETFNVFMEATTV